MERERERERERESKQPAITVLPVNDDVLLSSLFIQCIYVQKRSESTLHYLER